jgi:hypothetical protein
MFVEICKIKDMKEMSKAEKEAYEYENSSLLRLRLAIFIYKFLRFCGKEEVDFILSLTPYFIGCILFVDYNLTTVVLAVVIHYFIVWGFLRNKLKLKLVTNEEQEEIKTIIPILEGFIRSRKNI